MSAILRLANYLFGLLLSLELSDKWFTKKGSHSSLKKKLQYSSTKIFFLRAFCRLSAFSQLESPASAINSPASAANDFGVFILKWKDLVPLWITIFGQFSDWIAGHINLLMCKFNPEYILMLQTLQSDLQIILFSTICITCILHSPSPYFLKRGSRASANKAFLRAFWNINIMINEAVLL